MLEQKLEDKTDALELLIEKEVFYEEEISEHHLMFKQVKQKVQVLTSKVNCLSQTNKKLRAEYEELNRTAHDSPRHEDIELHAETINSLFTEMVAQHAHNHKVRKKMNEFVSLGIHAVVNDHVETHEHRHKRRTVMQAVKKMWALRNGRRSLS